MAKAIRVRKKIATGTIGVFIAAIFVIIVIGMNDGNLPIWALIVAVIGSVVIDVLLMGLSKLLQEGVYIEKD